MPVTTIAQTIRTADIVDPDAIVREASITFALAHAAHGDASAFDALRSRRSQIDDWLNGLRTHLTDRRNDVGNDWNNACHRISAPFWKSVEAAAQAVMPSPLGGDAPADVPSSIAWLEDWANKLRGWQTIEQDPATRSGIESVLAEIESRLTALRAVQRATSELNSVAWSVAMHMACHSHPYHQRIRSDLSVRMAPLAADIRSAAPAAGPAGAAGAPGAAPDSDTHHDIHFEPGFLRDALTTAFIAYAIAHRERDAQCAAWVSENRLAIDDWMIGRRIVLDSPKSGYGGQSWADIVAEKAMTTFPDEFTRLANAFARTTTITSQPITVRTLASARVSSASVSAMIAAMQSDGGSPDQSAYILNAMSNELEVEQRTAEQVRQIAQEGRRTLIVQAIRESEYRNSVYHFDARRQIGLIDRADRLAVSRRPTTRTA